MLGKPKHLGRWLAIAVAIGLCCSWEALAVKPVKPPPPEDPVTYTLVELSGLEGWPSAINQLDSGVVEVVGRLVDNSDGVKVHRAHYWMVDSAGNVLLSLDLQTRSPLEPGAAIVGSSAFDVNHHGVIVGGQLEEGSDCNRLRPLLWPNAASDPIALPLPVGVLGAQTTSINDQGIVVGQAYRGDEWSLVTWKVAVEGGEAMVLDVQSILAARSFFGPQVVNSGYVSATVDVSTDPEFVSYRAVRLRLAWNQQQVWEVPDSRIQLFDGYSTASGVNETGTVGGRCRDGSYSVAFVMDVDGTLLDLPKLPGGRIRGQEYEIRNNGANALNNATPLQVVGGGSVVITKTAEWRGDLGVLWNIGADAVDMNAATSRKVYLHRINDAGWIAADAVDTEDQRVRRPIVLIPSR